MIRQTIDTINERIIETLPTGTAQVGALAALFYDQQEKTSTLKRATGERFSLDDTYGWQSLHLTDRNTVAAHRTFGAFTDSVYSVGMILVGVSRDEFDFGRAVIALRDTPYVVIDSYDTNTLNVLTSLLRVKTGPDKNYDPRLYAWAIRYHIEGVCEEDLLELTTEPA